MADDPRDAEEPADPADPQPPERDDEHPARRSDTDKPGKRYEPL